MLYRFFTIVSLLFVYFSITSCVSMKKNTTENKKDSLSLKQNLRVKTFTLPQSKATLKIPVSELAQLPNNASFIEKKAQATAQLQYVNDTIYVYATCDSLQQLIFEYEQAINRLSKSQINKKNSRNTSTPRLFIFAIAMVICICYIMRQKS